MSADIKEGSFFRISHIFAGKNWNWFSNADTRFYSGEKFKKFLGVATWMNFQSDYNALICFFRGAALCLESSSYLNFMHLGIICEVAAAVRLLAGDDRLKLLP